MPERSGLEISDQLTRERLQQEALRGALIGGGIAAALLTVFLARELALLFVPSTGVLFCAGMAAAGGLLYALLREGGPL